MKLFNFLDSKTYFQPIFHSKTLKNILETLKNLFMILNLKTIGQKMQN
jgi:hypothetical protein